MIADVIVFIYHDHTWNLIPISFSKVSVSNCGNSNNEYLFDY